MFFVGRSSGSADHVVADMSVRNEELGTIEDKALVLEDSAQGDAFRSKGGGWLSQSEREDELTAADFR